MQLQNLRVVLAMCRPNIFALPVPLHAIGESEAPAELATPRFGRSLTLPSNEFVVQFHKEHV